MLTAWGYEVDGSSIPPLLDADAFASMTGGKYANEAAVAQALSAASQAVRNACGWHICPQLDCVAHPSPIKDELRLPANAVTDVTSIAESGEAVDVGACEWKRVGLVRRTDGHGWTRRWDAIEVSYKAGYDAEAVPDLAEAVRAIAEGVLAASPGVMSESADGVSVSYSANASSIAAALTAQQQAALAPYKLVSAHAA